MDIWRDAALACLACAMSACFVNPAAPEGAQLSCDSDVECAAGLVCARRAGRCVKPEARSVLLSQPALILPASQTAVKSGDDVGIGGFAEPGSTIVSARLLDTTTSVSLLVLDPTSIVVGVDGGLGGRVVIPAVGDAEQVLIEVVVESQGLRSPPESSRSAAVLVDNQSPGAPVVSRLRLSESLDVDDQIITTMQPLVGIAADAIGLRLSSLTAPNEILSEVLLSAQGDAPASTFPSAADKRYALVAFDGAGNQSAEVHVELPYLIVGTLTPSPARAGLQESGEPAVVEITLTPQPASTPTLSHGQTALVPKALTGDTYSFLLTPTADEPATSIQVATDGGPLVAPGSGALNFVSANLDFVAPNIDATKVSLTAVASPGEDSVSFSAGAFVDDASPLTTLRLRLVDASETLLAPEQLVQGDGGAATVNLGDNRIPQFRVLLLDEAGNTTTLTLTNDIERPVLTLADVTPSMAAPGATVVWTIEVVDGGALNQAPAATLGGNVASLLATDVLADRLRYTFSIAAVAAGTPFLPIVASVTDDAGNSQTVRVGSVFIDATPPETTLVWPNVAAGACPQGSWNGEPFVFGTASEGPGMASGLQRVEVSIADDQGRAFDGSSFVVGPAQWLPAEGTDRFTLALGAAAVAGTASLTLSARAVDATGNVDPTPATVCVAIDPAGPEAPSNLVATPVATRRVKLTWQAPTAVPEGYRVTILPTHASGDIFRFLRITDAAPGADERPAIDHSLTVEVDASDTDIIIGGLPLGTVRFTVASLDAAGRSSPLQSVSAEVEASRPVDVRPDGTWTQTDSAGRVHTLDSFGNLYRLDVGAANFTLLESFGAPCRELLISARAMIVSCTHALITSVDGGVTWHERYGDDAVSPPFGEFLMDTGDELIAVWSGRRQVLRSFDGRSWVKQTVDTENPTDFLRPGTFADGNVYLGTDGPRLLRSIDGGPFATIALPQDVDSPMLLAQGQTVLAANYAGWFAVSTDGGLTFAPPIRRTAEGVKLLRLTPGGPHFFSGTGIVYGVSAPGLSDDFVATTLFADAFIVGTASFGDRIALLLDNQAHDQLRLVASHDNGVHWQTTILADGVGFGGAAVNGLNATDAWLFSDTRTLAVDTSTGAQTMFHPSRFYDHETHVLGDHLVNFSASFGLRQSDDRGRTWRTLGAPPVGSFSGLWLGPTSWLALGGHYVNPGDPANRAIIWVSHDQGVNWTVAMDEASPDAGFSEAFASGPLLFALGGDAAVYSIDDGLTFDPYTEIPADADPDSFHLVGGAGGALLGSGQDLSANYKTWVNLDPLTPGNWMDSVSQTSTFSAFTSEILVTGSDDGLIVLDGENQWQGLVNLASEPCDCQLDCCSGVCPGPIMRWYGQGVAVDADRFFYLLSDGVSCPYFPSRWHLSYSFSGTGALTSTVIDSPPTTLFDGLLNSGGLTRQGQAIVAHTDSGDLLSLDDGGHFWSVDFPGRNFAPGVFFFDEGAHVQIGGGVYAFGPP